MTVDYTGTFTQLGAELKIMRKTEAIWEHSHFADQATYSKRQVTAAYSTSVTEEEICATNGKYSLENEISPTLSQIVSTQKSNFENNFFPVLDAELSTSQSDKNAGAISYVYDDSLTNGQISILSRNGRFGALRSSMLADSVTIKSNTLTFGALTLKTTNHGVLSSGSSTVTGSDHTLSGTIVFEVTDDTVEAVKMSVEIFLTKALPDGTTKISGDNSLQVGKSWQDGPTGLTCSLVLGSVVETGDTYSCVSSPVITNPSEADSNKGAAYIYIEREAASPVWLVQWYRDAALTSLVAETTSNLTTSSTTLTITGASGMIVAFTFDGANANTGMPVAGNNTTVTLDIKSPRNGVKWTKTIVNNEAGNFATKLAHNYRVSLPSAGSPFISDALASSTTMV